MIKVEFKPIFGVDSTGRVVDTKQAHVRVGGRWVGIARRVGNLSLIRPVTDDERARIETELAALLGHWKFATVIPKQIDERDEEGLDEESD
jgi:hypothetical protein